MMLHLFSVFDICGKKYKKLAWEALGTKKKPKKADG